MPNQLQKQWTKNLSQSSPSPPHFFKKGFSASSHPHAMHTWLIDSIPTHSWICSLSSVSCTELFLTCVAHSHHFSDILQWCWAACFNAKFSLCVHPLPPPRCHSILGTVTRKFLNNAHWFKGTQSWRSEHKWFKYQGHSYMERFIMWIALFRIAAPTKTCYLTLPLSPTNLQHGLYHCSRILPKIHGEKESTTYPLTKAFGILGTQPNVPPDLISMFPPCSLIPAQDGSATCLPVTSNHFTEAFLSSYFLCCFHFWLLVLHFDSRFGTRVSRNHCHFLVPVHFAVVRIFWYSFI